MSSTPEGGGRHEARHATRPSGLLEEAARRDGHEVERLDRDLVLVRASSMQAAFVGMKGPGVTRVAETLARSLPRTRTCVAAAGVPVVTGEEFPAGDLAAGWAWARAQGGPWTLRSPLARTVARASAEVATERRFAAAWRRVSGLRGRAGQRVLVESTVVGTHLAVFVVDGRPVAASRLVPSVLVGDGVRTLEELLTAANEARRDHPLLRHHPLRLPRHSGRPSGWIPAAGEVVSLAPWPTLAAGATAEDVTDDLDPRVASVARAAVAAMPGLRYATVRLIVPRAAVGAAAAALVHGVDTDPPLEARYPTRGRPRDVAAAVLGAEFGTPARSGLSGLRERWARARRRRPPQRKRADRGGASTGSASTDR